MKNRCSLLLVLFLFFIQNIMAQRSVYHESIFQEYNKAMDLFEKHHYAVARECFEKIISLCDETEKKMKEDARFYSSLCSIELFNNDAEYLTTEFIMKHPGNVHTGDAVFKMGNYQFRKKKYNETLRWYNEVDPYELNNDDLAEFYFKKGYSYFSQGNNAESSKSFFEIKNSDSRYAEPSLYYYSHIEYTNRNYETALHGFLKLSESESFSGIVPYYISHIYYMQRKYDKVIEYAPSLLTHATVKRAPEIARIIGEAYYRQSQFKEAIPYLEQYREKSESYTREDVYQLAYAYYRTGQYQKATGSFRELSLRKDTLSQNSLYLLADCYIKLKDKSNARMAFYSASKYDFDKEIKEDALFNYAKLAYELSYSPFNEAVKAFNQYIAEYPESDRKDMAYEYLVKVFMSTRNYKDAIVSLEEIKNSTSNDLRTAYQRVAFYRGLELFNDMDFQNAIVLFDKSLNNSEYNPLIRSQCLYWKGEAYYRLNRYDEAFNDYQTFITSPGAFDLPQYNMAHYNIAYCLFKKKDYAKAADWFRKYTGNMKNNKTEWVGNAYVRIGDCYFINKKYQDAVDYYDKAVESKSTDSDYALFQKGFSYGLLGEFSNKIIVMNHLLSEYSSSAYYDDALYELGSSYIIIEQPDMAINHFQTLIDDYPNSSYICKSLMKAGSIYRNKNNYENALVYYKKVVKEYKGTEQAVEALKGLEQVYVNDMKDEQAYFAFVNELGDQTIVSKSEQDSLTYLSAENLYMEGDCDKSKEKFGLYIDHFKNGKYILNALFYKAECLFLAGAFREALTCYEDISGRESNIFTEQSLLKASEIRYRFKEYNEALGWYIQLEKASEIKTNTLKAWSGQMYCRYYLNKYQEAIEAGTKILMEEKIPEELFRDVHYILGQSYFSQNNLENALQKFSVIAQDVKNIKGAEAKYKTALIYFMQKEYPLSEHQIISLIDLNTPHQYWLAKSFILWADIYLITKNNFQAKQTLQSVLDNYDVMNDGIIDEAQEKLTAIEECEASDKMLDEAIQHAGDISFEWNDRTIPSEKQENKDTDKQDKLKQE